MKSRLNSLPQLIIVPIIFFGIILILHFILRQFRYHTFFDMDNYWPISIFLPKPPVVHDSFTLSGIILIWTSFIRYWKSKSKSIWTIFIFITLLTLSTNSLQGIKQGFIFPITGEGPGSITYHVDVQDIYNPIDLIRHYTTLQPTLRAHSRVHPPGAMLFSYLLDQIFQSPMFIALTQMLIGLLSVPLLYQLLRKTFPENTALISSTLLGLLPASQIYHLSSLDAVITTIFLLTIYLSYQKLNRPVIQPSKWIWLVLTSLSLSLAAFLTFAVLVLIPIILFIDWQKNFKLTWSLKLFTLTIFIYIILYHSTSFNYLTSLQIATTYEGPPGFYLFSAPISYLLTRAENIFEILIFFTPWLTLLLIKELKKHSTLIKNFFLRLKSLALTQKPSLFPLPEHKLTNVSLIAIFSLIFFFLAGAYYTGETARAANYIYPFLIIYITPTLNKSNLTLKQQTVLLTLVFVQTIIMQTLGWYAW